MLLVHLSADLVTLALHLADKGPEAEDVKAGWTAFAIFLGGLLAVTLLGFSLVKQLRKVEAARKAGVYDDPDEPGERDEPTGADHQPGGGTTAP